MILIEVNNQEARSNFQLLEDTEEWAKVNVREGVQYTIILNPNLGMPMRITGGKVIEEEEEGEGGKEKGYKRVTT